jgi:6-phosphogluconolactonase (cycloisomerase 2 family)
MKFMKFSKALLISALSAGVALGLSSCVRSYSVGYLYITGNVTGGASGSNGIISGYKIDHNTGNLTQINGLPVSSGGANPGRAVLVQGSRFLYVLNRGVNTAGTASCSGTSGSTVCNGSNITLFAVGGNGILTPQATYYSQGNNPFRITTDTSGNFLMVLDHDAPSSTVCAAALGSALGGTSCGDVTVFKIDSTTGRLSLISNVNVSINGTSLTYFPVPANPIDFTLASGYVETLYNATSNTSGAPGTGLASVFPYTYNATTGQLTVNQNSTQSLGLYNTTGIVLAGGVLYVMDNGSCTGTNPSMTCTASSVTPYTVGTAGALSAETVGTIDEDTAVGNPSYLLVESKSKYLYIANQGNNATATATADSGIGSYFITTSPSFELTGTTPDSFGIGSGPQCIVEDPSDQFIYTANFNDSTVTGRVLDPNSGMLNDLRSNSTFKLTGQPAWCLVDGRTD